MRSLFVVSQSEPTLPLQIEDAMRRAADDHHGGGSGESATVEEGEEKDGQQLARVKQDTKLGKKKTFS